MQISTEYLRRWSDASQRHKRDELVDRHGQGASHAGLAAAFRGRAHRRVRERPRLPGDALEGSACSPGVGTSHPVRSGLGQTKQTALKRSRGSRRGREEEDFLRQITKEGRPGWKEGWRWRGALAAVLPPSTLTQKGNISSTSHLIAAIKGSRKVI